MKKSNEKKVLALSALGVITLILVVVGATYAYFTAQGGQGVNTNVNVQTNTTDNLSFQVGSAISLTANQEDFGSGMGNKTGSTTASATLTANNATNNATRNYYLYLDITSNNFEYTTDEQTAELILTITDPNDAPVTTLSGYNYVTVGDVSGFDITTTNGLITIADNYEITSTGTETQDWNVTITFVNLDNDQNANAGKSFNATLKIQEEAMAYHEICDETTFACQIAKTYTNGSNGLYYHNVDLANGTQDNSYRYSGSNPNNYVCFGTEETDCQNAANQYRIIGVFDNQVKLIKATSIGNYVWEADYSTQGNTWDESTKPDIYTTLNKDYFGTLDVTWQNLIDQTHTWQVGGTAYSTTNTTKQYYDAEIKKQTGYEQSMAIGLMYVSDYGYGADPSKWTTALYENNYGTDNWLYLGSNEWLISRDAVHSSYALYVYSGNGDYVGDHGVNNLFAVRPSFYLSSSVELSGGSGTSADPYTLKIS